MRPFLHAAAIALSAGLLFLVEPMAAKAFLPWFGGAAGVWVACVLFFQLTLLAGYAYAFALTRFAGPRAQRIVHVILAAAAIATLTWTTPTPAMWGGPAWSILYSLAACIGLPFFTLSATSPLVQTWYAGDSEARVPYRLFALSNAASLAALLAYPVAIEPAFLLDTQFRAWAWAFILFAVLIAACAASGVRFPARNIDAANLPPWHIAAWWIALAACAAAMWPALANHLSQQVAAIPFLWVLPLAVYLLTFILCFESAGWYRPRWFRVLLPAACVTLAWLLSASGPDSGMYWQIPVLLAALFVCCMFCHGELAALKPEPQAGLAYFYLMASVGGAAGATFVAALAPALFDSYLELPVAVAACAILGMRLLFGLGSPRVIARWCLLAIVSFLVLSRYTAGGQNVFRERNFYGAMQVVDRGEGRNAVRRLSHGKTIHGVEFLDPARAATPAGYYGLTSGVALCLESIQKPNRHIGLVGLGAGALAAYGRPGDVFDFYEINPAVIRIARTYFHFLELSQAQVNVIEADGRMAIARAPSASFDALVLDAFSGDSIPVHLLTREAFRIYFDRLTPGGLLLVHVSNRYLDVASVVQSAARDQGRPVQIIHSPADASMQFFVADWAMIENRPADHPRAPSIAPWTDEYSSVFRIL